MALRLRRGTNAERLVIIPQEGEIIYTTDTKALYAGDGVTVGGNLITGAIAAIGGSLEANIDLNSYNIIGTGNINIDGTIVAPSFVGDGSQLTGITVEGASGPFIGDLTGSVFGDDSTKIIDGLNNNIVANAINADYIESLSLVGSLTGNVFADNSTLVVDGQNGNIYTTNITTENTLTVDSGSANVNTQINVVSNNRRSFFKLSNKNLSADLSVPNTLYGAILFNRDDINGSATVGSILGGNDFMGLTCNDGTNTYPDSNFLMIKNNGRFGFGTYTPAAKVDVQGDILATGSITPGVYADATARDTAITVPAEGMMIFNSALQKFQGYVSDTGLAGGGSSNVTPGWIDIN